ncbi:MAG TPA: penicillin-binding transpeptidase domain-containing protein [Acidobacteriota bacterium]|nr:penicillin-binding transpeptidase domain-containing protein [Acidobacteriota bacterium]HRV07386.1 penicillin-binding transpeptidase domain-containing protein [Acidobacteriota bacterium]
MRSGQSGYSRGSVILRWFLRVVPAFLLVFCLCAGWWADYTARMLEVRRALYEGHIERAHLDLARLQRSLFAGPELAFYRKVADLIQGTTDSSSFSESPAEVVDRLLLRVLAHRALLSGDFEQCVRLARFWKEVSPPGEEGLSVLYLAAGLLESGHPEMARSLMASVSREVRKGVLEHRIHSVLDALAAGARSLVQDRRGNLVGWVTATGGFRAMDEEIVDLFPVSTIRRLLPQNPPATLRLSLDLELSRLAAGALRGYDGSIVLMDADSGEILAAVTGSRSRRKWGDAALTQQLEIASVAKLVTTVAALRSEIDPDARIRELRCRSAVDLGGQYLYCPAHHGRLGSLARAMATSCNTVFAQLGMDVGLPRLQAEFRRFGFDGLYHNGLPLGRLLASPQSAYELGRLSIGLDIPESTPLHAAVLAAVMANNGRFVEPTLFSERDGLLGLVLPKPSVQRGIQLIPTSWLPLLHEAMGAVISSGGTAESAVPPSFRDRHYAVGMKTGTAATPGLGYHTNYAGFLADEDRTLAFCVRITGFRVSKLVQQASRVVTHRFLLSLGQMLPLDEERLDSIPVRWAGSPQPRSTHPSSASP